ncbi:hypothetical protein HK105_205948 [Polyrhizophydium stewartii]|uniref:Uncharacterized protein n=1 Tax=Polyrhizophydium stewartii TaxID=2732419 RepID=A0ABR4N508_9FUNG
MSDQASDFGDFGEPEPVAAPVADAAKTAAAPAATADGDDDFGSFGDPSPAPAPASAPEQAAAAEPAIATVADDDDDDDFGDFDDFAAAEPVPSATPQATGPTPAAPVAPAAASVAVPPPSFDSEPGNPAEEARIAAFLDADLAGILGTIQRAWGASDLARHAAVAASTGVPPNLLAASGVANSAGQQVLAPHPAFATSEWSRQWTRLAADVAAAESAADKFRWRKSLIRKSFLASINVVFGKEETAPAPASVDLFPETRSRFASASSASALGSSARPETASPAPRSPMPAARAATQQQAPGSKLGTGFAAPASHASGAVSAVGFSKPPPGAYDQLDPREADLLEAKRLCDITEEEMRRHSTEEIREFVKALMDFHSKMQEQANYWLDSKEQLVMDAEMHNKMIASLVQYAQQQQNAPKGGAAAQATGSKKKRFGSLTTK